VQIVSYSTPTTPGNCRVLFAVVMDRRTAPKRTMQLLDLKPAWLKFMDHYERNTVLDGDNCFLHMQVSLSGACDFASHAPSMHDCNHCLCNVVQLSACISGMTQDSTRLLALMQWHGHTCAAVVHCRLQSLASALQPSTELAVTLCVLLAAGQEATW